MEMQVTQSNKTPKETKVKVNIKWFDKYKTYMTSRGPEKVSKCPPERKQFRYVVCVKLEFPPAESIKVYHIVSEPGQKVVETSSFHHFLFHNITIPVSALTYKCTWTEASRICRTLGQTLPYFTSEEAMNDLIKLLKVSGTIPPYEAIYIGLKISNLKQVGTLPSITIQPLKFAMRKKLFCFFL